MTPTQLFDAVRYYTNRPNETNTVLERWADAATGRLNTALRDHPRMYREGVYSAGAGQDRIPLAYDILRLRGLRRGSTWLPQFTPENVQECDDGFIDRGNCLELTKPQTDATTYYISYHQALTVPTVGSTASNWVLEFFSDVYLYAMLSEAAVSIKDRENGPIWEQMAKERIGRLASQGWDQNLADAPRSR